MGDQKTAMRATTTGAAVGGAAAAAFASLAVWKGHDQLRRWKAEHAAFQARLLAEGNVDALQYLDRCILSYPLWRMAFLVALLFTTFVTLMQERMQGSPPSAKWIVLVALWTDVVLRYTVDSFQLSFRECR